MSRWRNSCPDKILNRIEAVTEARFYLLRQIGPTGFFIKEDASNNQFKVLLGDPHSCSCSTFIKEKELCKHILWILLKKLRVDKGSQILYQLGLCERELHNILYGNHRNQNARREIKTAAPTHSTDDEQLKQKDIDKDDVCPICQETLFTVKKVNLLFCRFGCGNSVHPSCMKIWADHQHKSTGEDMIKCPLCRTQFATHRFIVNEHHKQVTRKKQEKKAREINCSKCLTKIQMNNEFRCTVCKNIWLCSSCITTQFHLQHPFEQRNKMKNNMWQEYNRFHSMLQFTQYPLELVGRGNKSKISTGGSHSAPSLRRKSFKDSSGLDNLYFAVNGINLHDERPKERNEITTTNNPVNFLPPLTTPTRGLINMNAGKRVMNAGIREMTRKKRNGFRNFDSQKNQLNVSTKLEEVFKITRCTSS